MNKESFSGIIYQGVWWSNSHKNESQWLKSIYENPIVFKDIQKEHRDVNKKLLIKDGKLYEEEKIK